MGFIRLLMLKTVNYADKIENTVTFIIILTIVVVIIII